MRRALAGPVHPTHPDAAWLQPHQRPAVRRVRGILNAFGGCVYADDVGLGKTYVSLAVARTYDRVTVVAPASLTAQWQRVADELQIGISVRSHEILSRGHCVPDTDLLVVDEAHRFRNPATIRYDRLAASVGAAQVLLVTATPIVNTPSDLTALIRLFLPDNALTVFGVPSLFTAAAQPPSALGTAVQSLLFARSWRGAGLATTALPRVVDQPMVRPSPIAEATLPGVLRAINRLAFPAFGAHPALRELLANHLFHRLASSGDAAAETLTRHRHYVRRALDAARTGTVLTRADARRLFGGWDGHQLDLLLGSTEHTDPVPVRALDQEMHRLDDLIALLRRAAPGSPKRARLLEMLDRRSGERTIVFTTSVVTALTLARHAGWKRVAVATGSGARIASGRIDLQTVLDLFSPESRGRAVPNARHGVTTLIATDLVSEGLNLQDANGIVHYDMPWTPLRLQQRLGRVARLGSKHPEATTWWFGPPEPIEHRLRLTDRLIRKARFQAHIGAVGTNVGGAVPLRRGINPERERLALTQDGPIGSGGHAVVRGPRAAAFAIDWTLNKRIVPHVLVYLDGAWEWDVHQQLHVLNELLHAPSSDRTVALAPLQDALMTLARERLANSRTGPNDRQTHRLTRRIVTLAARAGRERRSEQITRLDGVLRRLTGGTAVGGLRALERLLGTGSDDPEGGVLERWCDCWPLRPSVSSSMRVHGVLVGDGSVSS